MRFQLNLIKLINSILFISTFTLLSYTDAVFVSQEIEEGFIINLKYATLFLGISFCLLQIFLKKKIFLKNNMSLEFSKELKNIFFVVTVFLFLSLCTSLFHGRFTTNTIEELIKIIIPAIYAFCVLNTFNFKDIYNCMVVVLFVSLWGYILEVGLETFTGDNIRSIKYSDSFSPFESHYFAGTSIALCAFFMYYRKNKIYSALSLIFALLTFKRVSVLFALIFFLLPLFFDVNKFINKRWINIIRVFFVCATIVYFFLLSPHFSDVFVSLFNSDVNDFTKGRSNYIEKIINGGFTSYGFGSSTEFIGKSIEMDLIKIYIELSIIGLIVFVFNFWNIAGNKLYTNIFMFYNFVNLLTSHSLRNVFSWILSYIIIGCILYKQNNDLTYLKYKRKG